MSFAEEIYEAELVLMPSKEVNYDVTVTLLLLVVVVIRARIQGFGCTAAIRLIVHPVF
jgi:hypothetical protein